MKYRLERLPSVSRQLKTLPGRIQQEVNRALGDLAFDPYPPDAEELRDHYRGIWKIKVYGWRILYRLNESSSESTAGVDRTKYTIGKLYGTEPTGATDFATTRPTIWPFYQR